MFHKYQTAVNPKTAAVLCNQSLQDQLDREHQEMLEFQEAERKRLNKLRSAWRHKRKANKPSHGECFNFERVAQGKGFTVLADFEHNEYRVMKDGELHEATSIDEVIELCHGTQS